MRWFRVNRRWAGRLALFALALQLALSFGHIHAEDLIAPASLATASANETAPADHRSSLDHDGCAICATVHLAGTLLLPSPVVAVLPPDGVRTAWLVFRAGPVAVLHSDRFRARDPPTA